MKIVFSRNMPVEKKAARARVIVNAPAEQNIYRKFNSPPTKSSCGATYKCLKIFSCFKFFKDKNDMILQKLTSSY
ncbi:hypothetical protein BB050_04022 [Flavobacterium anhuiense]|uniref:Uncharacterized protein n=1 Tax=Flavobacterium anhuiense TaxID=459526 RepID=A0AAC9D3U4_9FLAO|nr:hypothetical protein [Flavobacterium anhuiense]AOC97100.1 hypothetical protein BB050_04022 [Flavobacterium anhuiense]